MKHKTPKLNIGISSCLLGERVRFDGGHKSDSFLVDVFGKYVIINFGVRFAENGEQTVTTTVPSQPRKGPNTVMEDDQRSQCLRWDGVGRRPEIK